jgi:hypothetical protein
MKRVVVLLMMVLLATAAFAQAKAAPKKTTAKAEPSWAKSYNADMSFNLYASVGWALGFTGSVAGELILTEFKIGPVPFDFGVAVRGAFEAYQTWFGYGGAYVYWGAAPLATLHLGLSAVPIEFYISAGIALYGSTDTYWFAAPVMLGFASVEGVIWHLSPNFGLLLEGGYLGGAAVWGVGVQIHF